MSKNILTLIIVAIIVVVGIAAWAFTRTSEPAASETATSTTETSTSSPNSGGATTTPLGTTSAKSYTMTEVATHNGRASCWSAVNGSVYDLTTWIDKHPGGAANILKICGKDGSATFTAQHGGQPRPEQALAGFKIGVVAQ